MYKHFFCYLKKNKINILYLFLKLLITLRTIPLDLISFKIFFSSSRRSIVGFSGGKWGVAQGHKAAASIILSHEAEQAIYMRWRKIEITKT